MFIVGVSVCVAGVVGTSTGLSCGTGVLFKGCIFFFGSFSFFGCDFFSAFSKIVMTDDPELDSSFDLAVKSASSSISTFCVISNIFEVKMFPTLASFVLMTTLQGISSARVLQILFTLDLMSPSPIVALNCISLDCSSLTFFLNRSLCLSDNFAFSSSRSDCTDLKIY